ncbi:B12-binding domain-containing radical SAM protein [Geofilum sp. OHC36d9]|uniref:B12-binding domain-containing radical SAM protein n=1 Tax=Geofilum sp. OHC36d9 TaxID=3458413 RepID=UPI004033188A
MVVSFIVPPEISSENPAERTAGCTRMVYPMPNIYELIVAAVLENAGYDVRYIDCVMEKKQWRDFDRFLSKDDSRVYLLWTVNLSIETDIEAAKLIRSKRPDAFVLFLGPGATYFTDKFLLDDKMMVVRGEPEDTVAELIECFHSERDVDNVKGLSFLKDGQICRNPTRPLIRDLDRLPFPARHFIEKYPYSNPKLKVHPYTTVLTSRNCPYQCIYCVPSSLTFAREIEFKAAKGHKPPVSSRSVENVVAEIDELASKGYKSIAFIDDNFIVSAKRLRPICDAIKKHGLLWGCQARVDAITDEIASILGDAGCCFVDLGVESFNDEILAYIKKGITRDDIFRGINLLKKYKVPVKLNILIGTSPLETEQTIKETLKESMKLGVSQVMFNIVAPFPGTEFYELALKNDWIVGGHYVPTDVQRHSILNYPNLSTQQMTRLLYRNNMSFFLRPSFIWLHIRKFRSWHDFVTAFKALKIKLFG